MPVQKRRCTSTRRDKRRTHWKAIVPGLVECPQCGELKLAFHVCKKCGYYGDKLVVAQKDKKAKEAK